MNISKWLVAAETQLAESGISTARLDALVLLEDITGMGRARLLAEPEMEIESDKLAELKKLLSRRAAHEPLAYIRGKTEFYGREFVITPAVLEPRPESETIIDILKSLSDLPLHPSIADIGTGSGALGITAKLERPEASIELIDIDSSAIKNAKTNVDLFTLSISVKQGDLLKENDKYYDVLLCNLPYVPDDSPINTAASHEPHIAIFGGPDGLDLYRELFNQVDKRSQKVLYILCESLPGQHPELLRIAASAGYAQTDENDFIQAFKHIHEIG